MDFELSEDQALLRDVSRKMLGTSCPSSLVRTVAEAGGDVDDSLWQRGVELGWTGLSAPESVGGAEQGIVELMIVAEELGRVVAPGPFMDTALAAQALGRHDSEELRTIAEGLAEGTLRAAWAHDGTVTSRIDGTGLVLTGRAGAVQAVAAADWLLVTTNDADSPALVLIDPRDIGMQRRRTLDESRGWYDLSFDDVSVPASRVLATGHEAVTWWRDAATVLICADALGVGERLLEMTVEHATTREQFGRPLGSFQAIKHKAADMLTALKGVRAATALAAMALDAGQPNASLDASIAKAYTSEGISALAGEALQVHGGIGFSWEHDLHLFLRRAKTDEIVLGGPEAHYERIVSLVE